MGCCEHWLLQLCCHCKCCIVELQPWFNCARGDIMFQGSAVFLYDCTLQLHMSYSLRQQQLR